MEIFKSAVSVFWANKKAAFTSGALSTGVLFAGAAYTDKVMGDHNKLSEVYRTNIYSELGHLGETGKELKLGLGIVNENLILSLRNQGYHGKIKKIEFEDEPPAAPGQ